MSNISFVLCQSKRKKKTTDVSAVFLLNLKFLYFIFSLSSMYLANPLDPPLPKQLNLKQSQRKYGNWLRLCKKSISNKQPVEQMFLGLKEYLTHQAPSEMKILCITKPRRHHLKTLQLGDLSAKTTARVALMRHLTSWNSAHNTVHSNWMTTQENEWLSLNRSQHRNATSTSTKKLNRDLSA